MRWSARLRGVPRNRGASRRPRTIRRLGRIKTPDGLGSSSCRIQDYRTQDGRETVTARAGSRRRPSDAERRRTGVAARTCARNGGDPGTDEPHSTPGGTSSSSTCTATGDAGQFRTRPPDGSGPPFRPGAKPQARSVAAEPPDLNRLDTAIRPTRRTQTGRDDLGAGSG